MLTGSGIASAFCALHVLSATATWEVRVAVVVFTVAACMADAICMAIGHVWTSFVLSSAHAQERSRERESLDDDKGNAKARLVDMLLARGMLKIDAMSLADTLEGYPDMFVSALMGDSLFAGSEFPEDETDDGQVQYPTIPIGGAGRTSDGSFGGLSWKFPSYGGFNEIEHDPESHAADAVWKESQIEGFFMMFGFAVFSLIPSLLWLMIPRLVTPEPAVVIESAIASAAKPNGQVISLPSLIISISGVLMWFLGVWKSRYLESNWIMSGIENVLVLLVCVLSAYGVGYCLCYLIGGGEGVTLTNVIRHHSY
jgi:VIT family